MIRLNNWVIVAIRKHVIAKNSLPCAGVAVGIDKPAGLGIVISALQIVKPGFGIVIVSTIPQGIDLGHGTGCLLDLAVGVIAVAGDHRSAAVDQIRHISLKVGNVVIGHRTGRAVGIGQRVGGSLGVVGEIQNFRCDSSVCGSCGNRLPQKPSASVDIAVFLRDRGFHDTYVLTSSSMRFSANAV